MTGVSLSGNKNYYTKKQDYNVSLEAGKEYIFEIAGPQEYYNPAEFQIFQPVTAVGASATILFGEGSIKDRE